MHEEGSIKTESLGKYAIITGAAGGIGMATVRCFASHGVNVYACVHRMDSTVLKEFAAIADGFGVEVSAVEIELADEQSVKTAIKSILSEKKNICFLVNNAGIAHGGTMQMTPMQTIRDVFDVNFFSPILIMQLISRSMMKNKHGSIVNVCSTSGLDMAEGGIAYGSSKASLAHATRVAAAELARFGVRVNAVAPAITDTPMALLNEAEARESMLNSISMGRIGTPEEIANAIWFLSSEESSFITGQVIRVDGGKK